MTSSYVCPQCGPDARGADEHARLYHELPPLPGPSQEALQRYRNDALYHALVRTMVDVMARGNMSPDELREAAEMAITHQSEDNDG